MKLPPASPNSSWSPAVTAPLLGIVALLLSLFPTRSQADPTTDGLYAGFLTSHGTFWCRLEFQKAPRTVANFVGLAEGSREWIDFRTARIERRAFYDGLTFHRVIDKFMIQGGSPNGLGNDSPGYQFADEFDVTLRHSKPGILSMANSGPNSNGSQFFVTVTNTPWLNNLHSVFGEVVEGMDNVYAISQLPTVTNDRPTTPVVIQELRLLRIGAAAQAFNPAAVTPPLPNVGVVPSALRYTSTNLTLLIQPSANHFQHVFYGSNLVNWTSQTIRSSPTSLDGTGLKDRPRFFFRVLDGGFEP